MIHDENTSLLTFLAGFKGMLKNPQINEYNGDVFLEQDRHYLFLVIMLQFTCFNVLTMTRPERTPASSPRKKNLLGIFLYIKLSFKFLKPLEQTPMQVSEIKFLVLL